MAWDVHTLFLQYSGELRGFLRNRGMSDDIASDIAQDSFVRIMTAEPKGSQENPRAYLYRITRNLLIDHRRREAGKPFEAAPDSVIQAVADPKPCAETVVYDKQRLALSEAALAELPDRTRRAFELYRIEGMTIAEVGQTIGLSTTRTWALIRDAYRHVRIRLHDI